MKAQPQPVVSSRNLFLSVPEMVFALRPAARATLTNWMPRPVAAASWSKEKTGSVAHSERTKPRREMLKKLECKGSFLILAEGHVGQTLPASVCQPNHQAPGLRSSIEPPCDALEERNFKAATRVTRSKVRSFSLVQDQQLYPLRVGVRDNRIHRFPPSPTGVRPLPSAGSEEFRAVGHGAILRHTGGTARRPGVS